MNCCTGNCNQGRSCPERTIPKEQNWEDEVHQEWAKQLAGARQGMAVAEPNDPELTLSWKQRIYNFIARILK